MIPPVPASLRSSAWKSRSATCGRWTASAFMSRRARSSGLLGPNGAGKTTTINMILGVLEPSAGRIEIEGVDLAVDRSKALSCTNFAAVYAPLPGNLTVEQNLRVFGMLYAVENLSARIEKLLAVYDLVRYRRTKAGVLSSGEQTRLSLAKAMLNLPRLLLLDEPTASIDPSNARDIRAGIAKFVDNGHLRRVVDEPQHVRGRRRSAIACCSCRMGGSCSRAIRRRCPKSTARQVSTICSSTSRKRRCTRRRSMNASRVGAIVLADVLSLSRQPAAHLSHLHLCRDRYPGLGLSHPLPQFGLARGFQFRAGAARRGAACGIF